MTEFNGENTLTFTIHGESGAGKTQLASSAPGPKLYLDAEGGHKFIRGNKIRWNPLTEDPPAMNGWDTCVVVVRDFDTLKAVYAWLNSGRHPFRSVIIDSITEMQMRVLDSIISGGAAPQTQDWGTLLRHMEKILRDFRDLTTHPDKPVQCVIFTALSGEGGPDGHTVKPFLSGQIKIKFPGYVDTIGYLFTQRDVESNTIRRGLMFQSQNGFLAKDRTGMLPEVMEVPHIAPGEIGTTIPDMLDIIYGETKKETE
jgi:hypothetical protein